MILITGGAGFIGREVTRNLLSKGHQVRLLARNPEGIKSLFPKAEVVWGDITDINSLDKALDGVDTVIHLAGLISYSKRDKDLLHMVNVEGTRNLLAHCGNVNRFVFSSSVSVYG